ncbi:MAG: hypothetical protein WCX75_08005 [Fibrobacteraceae bacterium]
MSENERKDKSVKKTENKFSTKKNRPFKPVKSSAPVKAATFTDSLEDRFGDNLAAKLKKHIEDGIKRKIKEAQSDPNVQRASAKYGK